MKIFRKIGKFTVFSTKLTIKPNNLRRKLRKVGFFAKISTNFRKIISTNNCMWLYIRASAKTIIFSTQTEVEIIHKLFFCKTTHNFVEKTPKIRQIRHPTQ